MLYKLPTFIFYPTAIAWSILYGSIAGFIFKILSVYENWKTINHLQIQLWKKFPYRSYRKYIETMWSQQFKGSQIELAEYSISRLEKAHPEEPFPFSRMLINTLFMILILPFMAISGLFFGPLYVFRAELVKHQRYFNRPAANNYN